MEPAGKIKRKKLGELIVEMGLAECELVENTADAQTSSIKKKIGQLLVDEGHITQVQLERALALQGSMEEEADPARGDAGATSPNAVSEVEAVSKSRKTANSSSRLGDIIVELGYVEREIIEGAVKVQGYGVGKMIGELLLARGHVTRAQLDKALMLQQQRMASAGGSKTQG